MVVLLCANAAAGVPSPSSAPRSPPPLVVSDPPHPGSLPAPLAPPPPSHPLGPSPDLPTRPNLGLEETRPPLISRFSGRPCPHPPPAPPRPPSTFIGGGVTRHSAPQAAVGPRPRGGIASCVGAPARVDGGAMKAGARGQSGLSICAGMTTPRRRATRALVRGLLIDDDSSPRLHAYSLLLRPVAETNRFRRVPAGDWRLSHFISGGLSVPRVVAHAAQSSLVRSSESDRAVPPAVAGGARR